LSHTSHARTHAKKPHLSFFSSGYDHVLLESYLVPYLYEKGYGPKMEKRGNKVSNIKTRNGTSFRDITKLLAPSTNLRNFGRLFNLEQAKAHFPFGISRPRDYSKAPTVAISATISEPISGWTWSSCTRPRRNGEKLCKLMWELTLSKPESTQFPAWQIWPVSSHRRRSSTLAPSFPTTAKSTVSFATA